MPGIWPIVADGPLAAWLWEAVGHAAGGIARTLEGAGLDQSDAQHWEARINAAAVLVGAHVDGSSLVPARGVLERSGAGRVSVGTWTE